MTTSNPSTAKLALLIDGDNVSSSIINGLMAEVATYGSAGVRRIYADWTSPQMKSWKECLLEHSISPIQQFAYTTGKNATDGAMIIDAMDLLYTGRFSGFCIVSSDSDFVRLATRIREQGVTFYGFGKRQTSKSFVAACDKFVFFDVLDPGPVPPLIDLSTTNRTGPSVPVEVQSKPQKVPIDEAARIALARAVTNVPSYNDTVDDGSVNLAEVGAYLRTTAPDIHARNYGYEKLREFIEASGIVEQRFKQVGDNPPVALVRLKTLAGNNSDASVAMRPRRPQTRCPARADMEATANADLSGSSSWWRQQGL